MRQEKQLCECEGTERKEAKLIHHQKKASQKPDNRLGEKRVKNRKYGKGQRERQCQRSKPWEERSGQLGAAAMPRRGLAAL